MSGPPPALPPRNETTTVSERVVPLAPEVPPKDSVYVNSNSGGHYSGVPLPNNTISYGYSDSLSVISVIRQVQLYSSPQMNEISDLFSVNNVGTENLKTRLAAELEKLEPTEESQYWAGVIKDYSNQFIRDKRIDELETHLASGITENLRALVYLKTLQIRYKIHHKESYESLVTKARYSDVNKEQEGLIESLPVDARLKDIIRVFNFYTNEKAVGIKMENDSVGNDVSNGSADESHLHPNNFIISISKIVENIPNLTNEEILYVMLKINKLYTLLIKDELFYKINRSLEDQQEEVFKHISVQGINLQNLYKKTLSGFLTNEIDSEKLAVVLDFVVFEGFDFILRLLIWAFTSNQEKILQIEGDELNGFLYSAEFFNGLEWEIRDILSISPNIIKYENEYHLMTANSLNNNNNELMNLKEVNDDLLIKINELNRQLENLRITHGEILGQSESYTVDLEKAQAEKDRLLQIRDDLQEKYEHLTMKENVKNTTKANKEFSARNAELEAQIEVLKKNVETKKAKLAKLAPSSQVSSPVLH